MRLGRLRPERRVPTVSTAESTPIVVSVLDRWRCATPICADSGDPRNGTGAVRYKRPMAVVAGQPTL